MLFFSSETFQQNVSQESLGTITRSCLKDYGMSHRTHQQSKQISVRVTDGLTKSNNTTRLDLITSCVIFIVQSPNKDELTKELLQYQEEGTGVDERTAELYSEQGNDDITELVICEETTQCEICQKHNRKGKLFLRMLFNTDRKAGNVERNDETGTDSL